MFVVINDYNLQVSIKKIIKRNLADVGISQSMHLLTKYINKKTTLFNNYSYISSSKFSAKWRATATYVGMYGGLGGCLSLQWHHVSLQWHHVSLQWQPHITYITPVNCAATRAMYHVSLQ